MLTTITMIIENYTIPVCTVFRMITMQQQHPHSASDDEKITIRKLWLVECVTMRYTISTRNNKPNEVRHKLVWMECRWARKREHKQWAACTHCHKYKYNGWIFAWEIAALSSRENDSFLSIVTLPIIHSSQMILAYTHTHTPMKHNCRSNAHPTYFGGNAERKNWNKQIGELFGCENKSLWQNHKSASASNHLHTAHTQHTAMDVQAAQMSHIRIYNGLLSTVEPIEECSCFNMKSIFVLRIGRTQF